MAVFTISVRTPSILARTSLFQNRSTIYPASCRTLFLSRFFRPCRINFYDQLCFLREEIRQLSLGICTLAAQISRPSFSTAVTPHPVPFPMGEGRSPNAAFETDGNELLRFGQELHRQLLEHVADEAVHDQRHRLFLGQSALQAIKQLIV